MFAQDELTKHTTDRPKSEHRLSKMTEEGEIFHGYCKYRSVDADLCRSGKFDNECVLLSDKLNEIFKNTDLRSFLKFENVLVTCSDKEAKGSRLIRQFLFPFEDDSGTQEESWRLCEITDHVSNPSVEFNGNPVIVLHEKAIENDETLSLTVMHEIIHANDFVSGDRFSNLLYFSPISYIYPLLFKMPIFIGFICIWTILGSFAKSLFPDLFGLFLDVIYLLIGPSIVILIILEYLLELRTEFRAYQFVRGQKLPFEFKESSSYMFKGIAYLLVGVIGIVIIIIVAVISDPYIRYFDKIFR